MVYGFVESFISESLSHHTKPDTTNGLIRIGQTSRRGLLRRQIFGAFVDSRKKPNKLSPPPFECSSTMTRRERPEKPIAASGSRWLPLISRVLCYHHRKHQQERKIRKKFRSNDCLDHLYTTSAISFGGSAGMV